MQGPHAWNALLENIRHETGPNCLKRKLETFTVLPLIVNFIDIFNKPFYFLIYVYFSQVSILGLYFNRR